MMDSNDIILGPHEASEIDAFEATLATLARVASALISFGCSEMET